MLAQIRQAFLKSGTVEWVYAHDVDKHATRN
jgi:hypothetical protein